MDKIQTSKSDISIPPIKQKLSKNKFSKEDDALLKRLVHEFGTESWSELAAKMPNRNARQLRERWNNYLRPNLSVSPWTTEENSLLLEKFNEYGSKWCIIGKFFPNRSINHIRYHLQSLLYPKKKDLLEKAIIIQQSKYIKELNSQTTQIEPFTIAQLLN